MSMTGLMYVWHMIYLGLLYLLVSVPFSYPFILIQGVSQL